MRWLGFGLLAMALVVGAALIRRPSEVAAGNGAAVAAPRAAVGELRGAGSCAAAACHNGNGAKGEKGSEYTTWVLHDKHARAFEVLYNKKSLQIEKNRQLPPCVQADHPEFDPLCLNCHVQPGIEKLPRRKLFALEDGVGCEACHGAAGGWLTQHYTASWRAKTAKEKQGEGMVDTKDLRVRAELCVRCHVGTGDVDVNHDLIAAGHPRLAFEYAAFHANLPKHWDVRKDKVGRPDFEARLWALGQAVSAKAALELLAHRAEEKNQRPWPEFAEYDCYACHHDIKLESWRRDREHGGAPPGTLPWGTWYYGVDLEATGPEVRKDVQTLLIDLSAHMEKPRPDRAEVASRATKLAEVLGKQVRASAREKWDAQGVGAMLRQVAADGGQVSGKSWDGAAQVYLALAALYAARADLDPHFAPSTFKGEFAELRRLLKFPSAPTFGARYDSPRDFSPDEFREVLERVRRGLRD